jgi:hypothetical protein
VNPFVTGLCKGVLRSPLKGGSRTFAIPANGGHPRDHHHITQLSSFFVRTEGRSKFVGANLFPAENPVDARREVVAGTNYLELIALRSQLIGIAMEIYTWNCNSSELQPKELQSLRIAACLVTKPLFPRSY